MGELILPLVHSILGLNDEQSAAYEAASFERRRYWAVHPTFFAALKCMDGRLNLSRITRMPIGLVRPYRSLGGRFEIYWPTFIMRLRAWVMKAANKGSLNCIFVTYHYSASDNDQLGCAGWHHDSHAAIAHAKKLCRQLRNIFLDQVVPIVTGIETDRDVLILHGPHGEVRGDELMGCTNEYVHERLRSVFGDEMPDVVRHDLVPFLSGNSIHIASLGNRPLDRSMLGHTERILAVGQGFEWLAAGKRKALIINDATLDLREPIQTAGQILAENLKGTPADDHAMIFTSVPFEDRLGQRIAIEKSPGLLEFAQSVLAKTQPDLWNSGRLEVLVGATDERDMHLSTIATGLITPDGNFHPSNIPSQRPTHIARPRGGNHSSADSAKA